MLNSKIFFIVVFIFSSRSIHCMNFEKFDVQIIGSIVRQLAIVNQEKDISNTSIHIAALSLTNKDIYKKVHNPQTTNMLVMSLSRQFKFPNGLRAANYLWRAAGAKQWINRYLAESGLY